MTPCTRRRMEQLGRKATQSLTAFQTVAV